jgi:acetylornithine deacetylase/succinyl-diaminopimelate desuccinylase-like protein
MTRRLARLTRRGAHAVGLLATAASIATAQSNDPAALRAKVRAWRVAHEPEIIRDYADLLALPNRANDSTGIRRNVEWLVAAFAKRGVALRPLDGEGGPPPLYGELRSPGAQRTVVVYVHYDGQPVDRTQWANGDPWKPELRDGPLEKGGKVVPLPTRSGEAQGEWRLYARSAGDDKAPFAATLAALDALKSAGVRPSVNVKFFFDGEEEVGSPHLRAVLEKNRALLTADGWLFADGPDHQTRRTQILFGARGVMGVEMTLYGPLRALHSGHYGNWAPNPIAQLATLLASMRDAEGKILVPGFYDDVRPVGPAERRAIAAAPSADSSLRAELALGRTEGKGVPLAEAILQPAFNLRGIRGGAVGAGAANAVPTEASASVDFRLVPDEKPARVRELVEAHLTRQGYHIVSDVPDAETRRKYPSVIRLQWDTGYAALRSPLDAPFSRAVVRAVTDALGTPPVEVPILGGSLPLSTFGDVLGATVVIVPIANYDDNQHASNENLRLQNLWDGIEEFAGLFARLGVAWPGAVP